MTKKNEKPAGLRKWFLPILGMVCLLTAFASCTTMQVNGLSMVQPSNDYQMLGTFETKVSVHKGLGPAGGTTLFNLFSDASDNKIQEAIRKEVQSRGGTAAINVKITWGADPVQLFLNMLTLTLYAPATATISGTVIKDK